MRAKALNSKYSWVSLLIILVIGVVFGGIITYLTSDVSALSWLNVGYTFGLSDPFVLDLYIIKLTFGLSVNVNVAVIIGIIISAVVYRYVF